MGCPGLMLEPKSCMMESDCSSQCERPDEEMDEWRMDRTTKVALKLRTPRPGITQYHRRFVSETRNERKPFQRSACSWLLTSGRGENAENMIDNPWESDYESNMYLIHSAAEHGYRSLWAARTSRAVDSRDGCCSSVGAPINSVYRSARSNYTVP